MIFNLVIQAEGRSFASMVLAQFLVESLRKWLGEYKYATFTADDISSEELADSDAVIALLETHDSDTTQKLYRKFREAHPDLRLVLFPACPHYDLKTVDSVRAMLGDDPNTTLFLFDGIGSNNLDRLIDELEEIAD